MARKLDFRNLDPIAPAEPGDSSRQSLSEVNVGDGNTSYHADKSGIWLGAKRFADATFSVSMLGILMATGAIISGTITAIAGAIGGFVIGTDYIRDAGNNFGMASTVTVGDDVRFWAGDTFANRGVAPFFVTEAGNLTANSATIVGTVSGRSTATIAGAIDASGNLITDILNARLNSSAKTLLAGFTFGAADYAGAVSSGTITWNTTTGALTGGSGVLLYRGGIIGASGGVATFVIDATTGDATFAGTLSAPDGVIGGFDIGATTLSASAGGNTTTMSSGSTAFSAGPTGSPSFTVTQAGALTATSAAITGTISGRSTATVAAAINSSGNLITDLINARLDSSAKTMLSGFTFGAADYSGALSAGTITWNTTTGAITGGSGTLVYRGGIVGASAGVATFTLDAATGAATFAGTLSAPSGNLGGFVLGSDYIRDAADSMGMASTVSGSDDVRFWAGSTFSNRATAPFFVTEAGNLTANTATIAGTISGRSTATVAAAINSSGNVITDLINARLDSSAKTMLAGFTFGASDYAGAVSSGTITWNTTTGAITGGSGVLVYRGGIVGAAAGVATFTLDAATGAATFAGTLSAPSGNLGGFVLGSDYVRDVADSFGMASTVTAGNDVRWWAGSTFANRATAPFVLFEDGSAIFTKVQLLSPDTYFIGNKADGLIAEGDTGFTIARTNPAQTTIATGAVAGRAATLHGNDGLLWDSSPGDLDWDNSSWFSCQIRVDATTLQNGIWGLGCRTTVTSPDVPDDATTTERHIAFLLDDGTLYASVANGTTQTRTDISSFVTLNRWNTYSFVYTAATSVVFYINGVAVATISTNIPTGATDWELSFGIETQTSVARTIGLNNNYYLSMRQS